MINDVTDTVLSKIDGPTKIEMAVSNLVHQRKLNEVQHFVENIEFTTYSDGALDAAGRSTFEIRIRGKIMEGKNAQVK